MTKTLGEAKAKSEKDRLESESKAMTERITEATKELDE
jgi:hypothetical protein